MFDYILRLFILVPMVGGLAWGSLWMWRRVQQGVTLQGSAARKVMIVDSISLGTAGKFVVVDFGGREWLVAVSRTGISLIANNDGGDFHA